MATILGPSALAAALGISRQMVYQYEREGKIARTGGKFELEEVQRQLAANVGSKQGGPPRRGCVAPPLGSNDTGATVAARRVVVELEPQQHGGRLKRQHAEGEDEDESGDTPPGSKVDLEKKLLKERVRKARLYNDREERALIDAGEAIAAWGNMVTTARNQALMLPSLLAPQLALETDPVACEEILKKGIDAMLSELSEWKPEIAKPAEPPPIAA